MTNDFFISCVKRNSKRLYLIALSFTKNQDDAEDIIQNVFLKLWKHSGKFEDNEHIDKWLTRVCVNECKNYIKLPFKKHASLDEIVEQSTFDSPMDYDVFNAIMSLSKKERTVIHLFYYEDMSIIEISKILGISQSSVKTRLYRARQNLKTILGDDWINE